VHAADDAAARAGVVVLHELDLDAQSGERAAAVGSRKKPHASPWTVGSMSSRGVELRGRSRIARE